MATERVEMQRTVCDGCGKVTCKELDNTDPVLGFHGHVAWHHERGGNSAAWYACRARCISGAVKNALQRELRFDHYGDRDPDD